MFQPKNFKVCVICNPPHVDNCPECFGWGLHLNGLPISASEVDSDIDFVMCPECFGEPTNEDIFILWGHPDVRKPVGILNIVSK